MAVIGSCVKGRHEGLPCCGDSLSHCVGNLWSEGSTSATCACRGFVRCLKSSCWDVGDVLVEKSTDGAGCQVLQLYATCDPRCKMEREGSVAFACLRWNVVCDQVRGRVRLLSMLFGGTVQAVAAFSDCVVLGLWLRAQTRSSSCLAAGVFLGWCRQCDWWHCASSCCVQ